MRKHYDFSRGKKNPWAEVLKLPLLSSDDVRKAIDSGLADVAAERTTPQAEVRDRIEKRLRRNP